MPKSVYLLDGELLLMPENSREEDIHGALRGSGTRAVFRRRSGLRTCGPLRDGYGGSQHGRGELVDSIQDLGSGRLGLPGNRPTENNP